jgi:tRNA (guanine26-N2/guanine27-N2)-dimethyltransferase
MSMNRDVAIVVAECLSGKIRVCDPMTASGVRAIRYLLECSNVDIVEASDVNVGSVEFARRMIQLNEIDRTKVDVVVADANNFLINRQNRFNLVDLDPFECPVRFYENALRSVVDGGVGSGPRFPD